MCHHVFRVCCSSVHASPRFFEVAVVAPARRVWVRPRFYFAPVLQVWVHSRLYVAPTPPSFMLLFLGCHCVPLSPVLNNNKLSLLFPCTFVVFYRFSPAPPSRFYFPRLLAGVISSCYTGSPPCSLPVLVCSGSLLVFFLPRLYTGFVLWCSTGSLPCSLSVSFCSGSPPVYLAPVPFPVLFCGCWVVIVSRSLPVLF